MNLKPSCESCSSCWKHPKQKTGKLSFCLSVLAVFSAACLGQSQVQPGFQLSEFPPSPFTLSVSDKPWPKSDTIVQSAEQGMSLSTGTTNRQELDLVAEIKALRSQFLELEAAANANDPYLRLYGLYIETAHDWVMRNHSREFGFANNFSRTNSSGTQRACNKVVDLIDMELYRQLAANTNFAPLLKSVFQAMEHRVPGTFSSSYARNDRLIGFQQSAPPKPAPSFESYIAELDDRHERILSKLGSLQREHGIPDDAVLGWMYGDLYRMLDGAAQQYVMLNTPPELDVLRRQLQQKSIALSNLRANP